MIPPSPIASLTKLVAAGRREIGMFVALLLICLGLWASNADFLGMSNVVNTTRQIGMLGILAVGISFVIITGGIDLSIGSIVGLTGVLIAKFSSTAADCWSLPLWVGITASLAVALFIGLVQGLLITRLSLQPFIVTLGGMLLVRGVSQTIVKGGTLGFGDSAFRNLADTGLLRVGGDALLPYPLLIFVAVAIVAAYVLHFTVFGRYIFAIGGNRDAAEYSGIAVKKVELTAYVISAGLAGVSGICYAAYIGQMSQQVGIAFELYAIAAAVLGGVSLRGGEGTIVGIIIGTAIMRVINNGITMFQLGYHDANGIRRTWRLDTNWEFIIIGAVILVAVILDQVVHIVQSRHRTRRAGAEADAQKQEDFDVVPASAGPTGPGG
jgi:ribose transport system permease protein